VWQQNTKILNFALLGEVHAVVSIVTDTDLRFTNYFFLMFSCNSIASTCVCAVRHIPVRADTAFMIPVTVLYQELRICVQFKIVFSCVNRWKSVFSQFQFTDSTWNDNIVL